MNSSIFLPSKMAQVSFAEKPQMKIKSLHKKKHAYLIHTRKALKGTIVNQAVPSLPRGLLESTVSLKLVCH